MEEQPFRNNSGSFRTEGCFGRIFIAKQSEDEIERHVIGYVVEVGLAFARNIVFQAGEELRQAATKQGNEVMVSSCQGRHEPAFEKSVVGLGRVEIRADAVAAGECGGGHVGAVEDVSLFNLGGVEKDGKAEGVEEDDDVRVGSHERTRWHVGSENGGLIFVHSSFEELITPLVVEVIEAILYGANEGQAITSWNRF